MIILSYVIGVGKGEKDNNGCEDIYRFWFISELIFLSNIYKLLWEWAI